jgi:hypothetical protein
MVYLTMVQFFILKLIMAQLPMKKLIKVETNQNESNHG